MTYNEIIIKDIVDYYKWLNDVSAVNNNEAKLDFLQSKVFYRGQSNKEWSLKPSLFRFNDKVNGINYEHTLINNAVRRLYKGLSMLNANIDKLVYLQHYGLPTRLLDITFNLLIALFFACNNEDKEDGAVYYGYYKDEQNDEIITAIADYIFNKQINTDYYTCLNYFKNINENYIEELKNVHYYISPFNNPRIKVQNGAFIIAPIFFGKDNNTSLFNRDLNDMNIFNKKRAIIPKESKHTILKQLSSLDFDYGTIFVGDEYELKAITNKIIYEQNKIAL